MDLFFHDSVKSFECQFFSFTNTHTFILLVFEIDQSRFCATADRSCTPAVLNSSRVCHIDTRTVYINPAYNKTTALGSRSFLSPLFVCVITCRAEFWHFVSNILRDKFDVWLFFIVEIVTYTYTSSLINKVFCIAYNTWKDTLGVIV